ncbi:MarR family winged helix-turn-helix transcriptional regulator [Sphingomonas morindae]|uniref:MarR family transcriptional regulator n=1 Tax=Sphingomonas morindae TaxID=1541170 RepID=A0ABY4XBB7_9SPHN|nr:MarR family transcriptional regulator [Sphingomonas morindae]USI74134.1 MarR family transcriptional regulator [Sphingomonas morindae]
MTEPDPAAIPLDHLLCFAVYSTGLAFNRVYKPLLDGLGLTYPQYLALIALSEAPTLSVGALGERLGLESNTLTPLIKRLAAAGLVERQRDTSDERVVRVALTEQGRATVARAACLPEAILAATGHTPGEIGAMRDTLLTLRAQLRAYAAAPQPRPDSAV